MSEELNAMSPKLVTALHSRLGFLCGGLFGRFAPGSPQDSILSYIEISSANLPLNTWAYKKCAGGNSVAYCRLNTTEEDFQSFGKLRVARGNLNGVPFVTKGDYIIAPPLITLSNGIFVIMPYELCLGPAFFFDRQGELFNGICLSETYMCYEPGMTTCCYEDATTDHPAYVKASLPDGSVIRFEASGGISQC